MLSPGTTTVPASLQTIPLMVSWPTDGRASVYSKIAGLLGDKAIEHILAIPQTAADLITAIAVTDVTGARMALIFIQDDGIQDLERSPDLLTEALTKATLLFASSESVRVTIQARCGKKIWLIPRTVPSAMVGSRSDLNPEELTLEGLVQWICRSLEDGFPADDQFEQAATWRNTKVLAYVDPPVPKRIHWEMQPVFLALHRLKTIGYVPEFILDVGASTGYWSHIASQVFPDCRYYLFEPLLERYKKMQGDIYRRHPEFVLSAVAAGNFSGEIELNVSDDLYGSSVFENEVALAHREWQKVRVPVKPLDEAISNPGPAGRGILKIDVQFSEHLVLEGAKKLLSQVDVIFIELSLGRFARQSKTFIEMINEIDRLGFVYFDYAGSWRNPKTGQLFQQDAVFARPQIAQLP
jgi:FkbM family methyltransferase